MAAPEQQRNGTLRQIPQVNALLESASARDLLQRFPRTLLRDEVRRQLARVRQDVRAGEAAPFAADSFFGIVRQRLEEQEQTRLQRVVNATGILIHTNLGRAPLAAEALAALRDVARGYSNLELDLQTGKRGERGGQTEALLCRLTGAEAALVVNNGAAAVLLAISALAAGGEVVISRGELVEIGGAFRVPDVIRQSGARLVEVGATNKTRLSDYEDALTAETRLLLKVHASNYRIVGFTGEAGLADLVRLGRERGLPVMQDLGSGALIDLSRFGLPPEPTVSQAVESGLDVVAFSGDKLLGGPQCGILAGRPEPIRRMGRHPLFRALRAGKLTLAALEATLRLYEDPERLPAALPLLQMLCQDEAQLGRKARRLQRGLRRLPGVEAVVAAGQGYTGGGTLPEVAIPSRQVRVRVAGLSAGDLARRLRRAGPPVLGVVSDDRLVLDVRTLAETEIGEVVGAFAGLLAKGG